MLYEDGYRYAYPNKEFFEVFAKKNCEVVIGLDIHDPKDFSTDKYIDSAMSVINDLNCNLINEYDLIEKAKERKKKYSFLD